jgi:hypothetical protein
MDKQVKKDIINQFGQVNEIYLPIPFEDMYIMFESIGVSPETDLFFNQVIFPIHDNTYYKKSTGPYSSDDFCDWRIMKPPPTTLKYETLSRHRTFRQHSRTLEEQLALWTIVLFFAFTLYIFVKVMYKLVMFVTDLIYFRGIQIYLYRNE